MKLRGLQELNGAEARTSRGDRFRARPLNRQRRQAGLMLEECLVYLSIWMVVSGLAFAAYYRVLDNTTRLRRNAADIARAVNAGERWRQDVRQSPGPVRLIVVDGAVEQALHLPRGSEETIYFFTGTNVLRRTREDAPWTVALAGVKSSQMIHERRGPIQTLRWEVELTVGLKKPIVQPLFTFLAVAPGPGNP